MPQQLRGYKLCKECRMPMLKRGQKRKPHHKDFYRHAQGCSLERFDYYPDRNLWLFVTRDWAWNIHHRGVTVMSRKRNAKRWLKQTKERWGEDREYIANRKEHEVLANRVVIYNLVAP